MARVQTVVGCLGGVRRGFTSLAFHLARFSLTVFFFFSIPTISSPGRCVDLSKGGILSPCISLLSCVTCVVIYRTYFGVVEFVAFMSCVFLIPQVDSIRSTIQLLVCITPLQFDMVLHLG